jgi:hypothetical protein
LFGRHTILEFSVVEPEEDPYKNANYGNEEMLKTRKFPLKGREAFPAASVAF